MLHVWDIVLCICWLYFRWIENNPGELQVSLGYLRLYFDYNDVFEEHFKLDIINMHQDVTTYPYTYVL